jgi:hypothetical protein
VSCHCAVSLRHEPTEGHVYLALVYDLERRILLWVGDNRTEEAVKPFFTREIGARRCHTLRVTLHGRVGGLVTAVNCCAPGSWGLAPSIDPCYGKQPGRISD